MELRRGKTDWERSQEKVGILSIFNVVCLLGLEQQYQLGHLIRSRYEGFLSDRYSPFEIYVRSSDYNRTLVSAQANLLAMYPPEDSELFTKKVRWRPIPVHTVPKRQDKVRS